MPQIRVSWWWMLPIILLTTGLAGQFLLYDALWFDEVMTYFITGMGNFPSRDLPDILWTTARDNSWPPAYFLMALIWNFLTGESLLLNRTLPFFIGLLSLAMMFRIGKSIFNSRVGVYASLLLGTSAFYLFYLHEMRGYSLYILTSLLHLWSYWILLKPHNERKLTVAEIDSKPRPFDKRYLRYFFAFATAFALYSHYVAVVSVAVLGLYHLIFERKNENWLDIFKLGVNGSIFYSLWIVAAVISVYNHSLTEWQKFDTALGGVLVSFSNNLAIPFIIIMLATLLLWNQHRAVKMLWFWIVGVIALIGLGNLYAQFIFHPRHMIVLLIPICLLIAYLVNQLEKRAAPLAFGILLIWVGAGIWNASTLDFIYEQPGQIPTIPLSTMKQALETSESCVQDNDAVVLSFWHQEIEEADSSLNNSSHFYYFWRMNFRYAQLNRMEVIRNIFGDQAEDVDYDIRVSTVVGDAEYVWLMILPTNAIAEERYQFETALSERGYQSCGAFIDRPDFTGIVYAKNAAACEAIMASCNGN